jgi:hypothetical protein
MRAGLLLLIISLIGTASAIESIDAGYFKVFFNMDTAENYIINTTTKDRSFMIEIQGENSSAAIVGFDSEEMEQGSIEDNIDDFFSDIDIENYDLYARIVDDQRAVLGVGAYPADNKAAFVASYQKPLQGMTADVVVASDFAWEDGTEMLLNTLAVELAPGVLLDDQLDDPLESASVYGIPYASEPYDDSSAAAETDSQAGANMEEDLEALADLEYNGHVTFSNNAGLSQDDAIVIMNAVNDSEGVDAEYYYLEQRYGERPDDWDLISQSLVDQGETIYDRMNLMLSNGDSVIIYFDITDFFGKF